MRAGVGLSREGPAGTARLRAEGLLLRSSLLRVSLYGWWWELADGGGLAGAEGLSTKLLSWASSLNGD